MIAEPENETREIREDDDMLILMTDGMFSAPFSKAEVAKRVHQLRQEGKSLQ